MSMLSSQQIKVRCEPRLICMRDGPVLFVRHDHACAVTLMQDILDAVGVSYKHCNEECELVALLEATRNETVVWSALIARFDRDCDGALTIVEFEALVATLLGPRGHEQYGTAAEVAKAIGGWKGFGGVTALTPELLRTACIAGTPFGPLQPALVALRDAVLTEILQDTCISHVMSCTLNSRVVKHSHGMIYACRCLAQAGWGEWGPKSRGRAVASPVLSSSGGDDATAPDVCMYVL